MEDYRPWPTTRSAVRDILQEAERLTWRVKPFGTTWRFKRCLHRRGGLKTENFSPMDEAIFTLHALNLAHNQLNEACNKVWTTAEFAHATGPPARRRGWLLVPNFSSTFSLGTLIPALYYATVSSMLAVMTSMGCIFFREDQRGLSRKDRDLNCLRTNVGWYVMKRTTYAGSVLKVATGDWHQMIVNFYTYFVREGYEVPVIDIEDMRAFRRQRDDTHYGVLSETTVDKTADLRLYFERLLFTSNFVGEAIQHVNMIQRERKGYTERHQELETTFGPLLREYAEEISLDDLISQLPETLNQQTFRIR